MFSTKESNHHFSYVIILVLIDYDMTPSQESLFGPRIDYNREIFYQNIYLLDFIPSSRVKLRAAEFKSFFPSFRLQMSFDKYY